MQIEFRKVVPVFLEEEKITRSQIWNNELVINKGDRLQVVAPSGSGKTSLLHFLYGLRKDHSGDILFDGISLKTFTPETDAALRSGHVSIVFQDLRLFPAHTVRQNLEIKRSLAPYHSADSIGRMTALLGIQNKLDKLVSTCSYGEQQRIAIIRSLMQPFDFLFLDEPFSHLDENNRHKAMQLIEEEAEARNAGIILADLQARDYFKADTTIYL